jgi:hypothetical protein
MLQATKIQRLFSGLMEGSFNNYVDKKRGMGVPKNSMLGHVKKDR